VSKSSSPSGRARGPFVPARTKKHRTRVQPRRLFLESLETRALLTTYTYPYGATVDDTGEYMLGKIAVNVVLMESDSAMAPHDNGVLHQIDPNSGNITTVNYTPENWTPAEIADVESKVTAAMKWWKDTFVHMFPDAPMLPTAPADSLSFDINFKYADVPVHTGYEPIAHISDDILGNSTTAGPGKGWLYDFLHFAGYDKTGVYSTDMRSFNDAMRQQDNADWAFTIFVVDNSSDADKLFGSGGSYFQAYSFPGGQFTVIPASRPITTFAHETGHQFWALDEYAGGNPYTLSRGYYNTQNLNSEEGRSVSFVQAPTIMSTDHVTRNPPTFAQSTSFQDHVLDPYTMAGIGWQDSDNDGVMDVLDVPFTLSGMGSYDPATGTYSFHGSTHVNALPNQNPIGTQNDITINQISELQYQINNGPWTQAVPYSSRTYSSTVSFNTHIAPGSTIRFRSIDLQNGVTSNVVTGNTDTPTNDTLPGLEGAIYVDQNGNGKWDIDEALKPGVSLAISDQNGQPIALQHKIEPDDYPINAPLNNVDSNASLRSIGLNGGTGDVAARFYYDIPNAGKVLTATDYPDSSLPTWDNDRQLRVDFSSPVSTVSIRAYGASSSPNFARLDAFDSSGHILARSASSALAFGAFTTLTVSRSPADIAYVIAYGWSYTEVVLDSLIWGPSSSTTTDNQGAFPLSSLPDGTYQIHVSAVSGYHTTNPASGTAVVNVSGGATTDNVNFGIAPDVPPNLRFHNYTNQYNVNPGEDSQITSLDVLIIINYINAHPGGDGTIPVWADPTLIGYIDVAPDNHVAADDVLAIINYINAHPSGPSGGEAAAPASNGGTPPLGGGSTQSEGEFTVPTAQNAAEYYAQNPSHLLFIRGADQPCNCAACRAARGQYVDEFAQPAEQLMPQTPNASVDGSSGLDTTLDVIAADVSQVNAIRSA
jgi:hypothetical protein